MSLQIKRHYKLALALIVTLLFLALVAGGQPIVAYSARTADAAATTTSLSEEEAANLSMTTPVITETEP